MFPSGFPKPPCSWNMGSAPLCCCFCNSLWEANKHGGIEQELLGHQPWRRSKECRMHVDHPNRTKIMINQISCRFKWDGNWEGRQSSFLAAGVLPLKRQPPPPSEMMCSMWIFGLVLSVAGTVWVWCLCFLSLLSLWWLFHRAQRSESVFCMSSHTVGSPSSRPWRQVPRWAKHLKSTGWYGPKREA